MSFLYYGTLSVMTLGLFVGCLRFNLLSQNEQDSAKILAKSLQPPHLIFMLADDMGWNDIGYHNPAMFTPNLDSLAQNGIKLNYSYMQQMCTPSRSAIMTGYYPHRNGLQHGVIWRLAPTGLPLQFTILPEKLQKLGYETHLVGKWHLGHCSWNYTPNYRGFDTFMGHYAGQITYYTHLIPGKPTGIDYHNNTEPLTKYQGIHTSVSNLIEVENILSNYKSNKPLFLYLAFQLPHGPLEVEKKYLDLFPSIADSDRKIFTAMMAALDDDVGKIVKLLKKYHIYENSILFFNSDNGGQVYNGANNFPLRGNKNTLYEGGTRVPGFVHSPLLKTTGYIYNGLIHAVDWFATLLELAGGRPDPDIDGINIWDNLVQNLPSKRTEFVYNIDNYEKNISGAIRIDDWKFIIGKAGLPNDVFTPENLTYEFYDYKSDDQVLERLDAPPFRLYNIKEDPSEQLNLAEDHPEKVDQLLERLQEYNTRTVKPVWLSNDQIGGQLAVASGVLTPGWCNPIRKVIHSN